MRSLDVSLSAEFAKGYFRYFFLLELDLTVYWRFTNFDIPIYISGNKYTPIGFDLDAVALASQLSADKMVIEIDDANQTLSDILLGEDVRNRSAILSIGAMDSNHVVIGTEGLFHGMIGEWDIAEPTVKITIVNELILWRKKAMRTASATCPWVFKGTECGYPGGETWCDKSYERCAALARSDYFGGFRFLPYLQETQIWWGRIPG